eukprot:1141252-Pelagomonas_calceolata.AAC.2
MPWNRFFAAAKKRHASYRLQQHTCTSPSVVLGTAIGCSPAEQKKWVGACACLVLASSALLELLQCCTDCAHCELSNQLQPLLLSTTHTNSLALLIAWQILWPWVALGGDCAPFAMPAGCRTLYSWISKTDTPRPEFTAAYAEGVRKWGGGAGPLK